jgi:RNA polymerase sigma-70 factor (ECF subfamily)
VAFLLALERLSPLERAVFLLHDVFEQDYADVAGTLERSEAAVRQLASRAREHVKAARPRFAVSDAEIQRLSTAFVAAAATGDVAALSQVLTEDAILVSDGGGKRTAALRVLVGRDDIMRLLQGIFWRHGAQQVRALRAARINGYPGLVLTLEDGPETVAFEPGEDGRIAAVYMMRNPDKLAHVS